jgi:hypothetical protein
MTLLILDGLLLDILKKMSTSLNSKLLFVYMCSDRNIVSVLTILFEVLIRNGKGRTVAIAKVVRFPVRCIHCVLLNIVLQDNKSCILHFIFEVYNFLIYNSSYTSFSNSNFLISGSVNFMDYIYLFYRTVFRTKCE